MMKRSIQVMQLISSLEVGGAEKLLLDLLDEKQSDASVEFTVVVMNQAVNSELKMRLKLMNCDAYFLERPEGHVHWKYLQALLKIISVHDIDIVHSHNTGSKWWAMLCKLCKPSLKLIFTVHDTAPVWLSVFHKFLQRVFIDHYIAVSKSVERLCEREGFVPVRQIYNGIDIDAYQNLKRHTLVERLQAIAYHHRPLRIVQIGRFYYPKKGQDLLIRAIAQCKQAGLAVHGTFMGSVHPYSEHSYQALKDLVAELNLQDEIAFVVNKTNVASVLREADLFVLPSRFEGLGLVVLESMAAGVPVIVSNIDGPAELVCHEENGLLFESDSVDSLVQAICKVYAYPEIADGFAAKALNFVKQFDISVMRQQYFQLYHQMLFKKNFLSVCALQEVTHGSSF